MIFNESYQFLKEKNIKSISKLKESISALRDNNYKTTRAIKDTEKQIDDKVQLIDQAEKYLKHKDTYKAYIKIKKSKQDDFTTVKEKRVRPIKLSEIMVQY